MHTILPMYLYSLLFLCVCPPPHPIWTGPCVRSGVCPPTLCSPRWYHSTTAANSGGGQVVLRDVTLI